MSKTCLSEYEELSAFVDSSRSFWQKQYDHY